MDLNELKLLSKINPENINNAYKTNLIIKFMNIKIEQPDLSQDQIFGKIGISSSTIKRIKQDLNVKSPYRYDIPLKSKKSKKMEPSKEIKEITNRNEETFTQANKVNKPKVKKNKGKNWQWT